jgi:hypothetical protein
MSFSGKWIELLIMSLSETSGSQKDRLYCQCSLTVKMWAVIKGNKNQRGTFGI